MAMRLPASDSAITVHRSSTLLYHLVDKAPVDTVTSTRSRILEAAVELFGARGVDAVSLDEIAVAVGVRKQTVLYWFANKDELIDAVFAEALAQLSVAIEAAVRAAPDEPLDRVDSIVSAVFRAAVRTPALLGLLRELNRLPGARAEELRRRLQPLVDRAIVYLGAEMEAGRLRRGDPRLVAVLASATVTGIATDPEALRAVGWTPDVVALRHLRDELRAFLRAALAP
jgi:TetR/AcrR family transcriptional regulator